MINVLFVYGDILRRGGIESYMMNYYRHISHDKIHIDFALQGYEKGVYDDEIVAGGSCIYHLDKPGKHLVAYKKQLKNLFLAGKYQIVHAHCDAMNCRILRLAKSCGIPVRIAHSHTTRHLSVSLTRQLFYEYCKHRLVRYATECWACSDVSGKWLFGNYQYTIVPNAINISRFLFDNTKRQYLQEQYAIDKEIVLGHIGHLDYHKNQSFLIDILKQLSEKGQRRYRLLLAGEGRLQEELREKADNLGLGDRVIFTGGVANPEDYYNLMDLFLMPSLFEGYPLVVTEAEANGLPCIVSEYITEEVNKIGMVKRLPLDQELWVHAIEEQDFKRNAEAYEQLRACGFDINCEAEKIGREYIRLYEKSQNACVEGSMGHKLG